MLIDAASRIDALGVIDVQATFMPGGEMPVLGGKKVIRPVNRLLEAPFAFRFATQDWHPRGSVTFASSHPGRKPMDTVRTDHGERTLWPDHALRGTKRADLHSALTTRTLDIVIRKGARQELEGYSAFSDLGGREDSGLAAMMRARGITRLFLAGLALDVCVAATAEDSVRRGFETFIVEDACRPAQADSVPALKDHLGGLGVHFVCGSDVVGQ